MVVFPFLLHYHRKYLLFQCHEVNTWACWDSWLFSQEDFCISQLADTSDESVKFMKLENWNVKDELQWMMHIWRLHNETGRKETAKFRVSTLKPQTKILTPFYVARYHIFCALHPVKDFRFKNWDQQSVYEREHNFEAYGCKFGARENPETVTIPFLVFYIQRTLIYFKIWLKFH